MTSNQDSKRARLTVQPKGTVSYTVEDHDTIEKVALRFNSTPSVVRQLNKIPNRMLFPGEILYVPDGLAVPDLEEKRSISPPPEKDRNENTSPLSPTRPRSSSATVPSNPSSPQHAAHKDIGPIVWSVTRQNNARPGRAERLKSDTSAISEPTRLIEELPKNEHENNSKHRMSVHRSFSFEEQQQMDKECLQRFIKLHVRLLTDHHVTIAGTLLVTPSAVMFDPDQSDSKIEKYGLIIRMDLLAGISLYEDLGMYEREVTARDSKKRRSCRSISVTSPRHSQIMIPMNNDEEDIHAVMTSLLDRIDRELNPWSETDTCVLFDASSNLHRQLSRPSDVPDETFSPLSVDEFQSSESFQNSSDLSQPLEEYKHSIGILSDDDQQLPNRIPSEISYVFDWKRFKRAAKVNMPYYLESCVSLDQFNKRFGEIDDLIYKQQTYIVRHDFEVPYYLCIRTSMHSHEIPSLHAKQYRRDSEIKVDNFHGEKQLEQEYWFAVPKDKVDQLHSFFLRWTPERELDALVDDDNQIPSREKDTTSQRGFVLLVTDDPEINNEHEPTKDAEKPSHYIRRESKLLKEWEIISVDEIYRRVHSTHGNKRHLYENSFAPPKLLQPSTLLNDNQTKQILLEIPARYHGLDWYMVFSTEAHGFSLNQLYRQSLQYNHDLPSLLVIRDVEQNIFGAFLPRPLMLSQGFYGTGETFLFTFSPEFRVFNWSGSNDFFAKGDLHSFGFGSGDGIYGLWMDGDLYHGRTSTSKTFNNDPLISHQDFIIASIEVWTFID